MIFIVQMERGKMFEIIEIALMAILGIQQIVIISKLENVENLFLEGDFEDEKKR